MNIIVFYNSIMGVFYTFVAKLIHKKISMKRNWRWFLISLLISIPTYLSAQQSTYFLHTIAPGESLYSIATTYNVSVADILQLNPGCDKIIKSGEKLRIPQKAGAGKQQFHTIQPGETLYKLTQLYNVSAQSICDANPGLSAQNFKSGQVIIIPQKDETNVTTSPVIEKTPVATSTRQDFREIHKVKRKETIYSISKLYGITEEELIAANPELKKEKLKKGKYLRIPYHKEEAVQIVTAPTNNDLFGNTPSEPVKKEHLKIAVLLPFMLNSGNNAEQPRMIEYYQGFLMAINELKKNGTSFDIYTFDTEDNATTIKRILRKDEMKDMDLIIGPGHSSLISEVSDFSKKNKIRMVIPFTSKCDEVFNNPYMYQINTPQSYLYSEVYEHFIRKFNNENLIFVTSEGSNGDKQDFIKGFKQELKNNNIAFKTINANSKESIESALSPDKDNILIPTSGSNIALIKLLPYLKALKLSWEAENTPDKYKLHLFGYPEWQTYTNDHLNDFYTFDTYFYTSFYANNLSVNVVNFQNAFRQWYHKEILNTYPKYAILGYETAYYILKGMSLYGNKLETNLDKIHVTPIQTSFKFERVNNWGGFINKKVFFIHFTQNHELIKIDFDK